MEPPLGFSFFSSDIDWLWRDCDLTGGLKERSAGRLSRFTSYRQTDWVRGGAASLGSISGLDRGPQSSGATPSSSTGHTVIREQRLSNDGRWEV